MEREHASAFSGVIVLQWRRLWLKQVVETSSYYVKASLEKALSVVIVVA